MPVNNGCTSDCMHGGTCTDHMVNTMSLASSFAHSHMSYLLLYGWKQHALFAELKLLDSIFQGNLCGV